MKNLFVASTKYVIVYFSNSEGDQKIKLPSCGIGNS
jgi:hypothetical protein